MATVADLYAQTLGRAPDAAGLAYWESMFGPTVDPTEAATFLSVAKVTEPEKVAAVAQTATQTPQIPEQPRGGAVKVSPSVAPKTVNDLYQTFYGTPGDAGGLAYWGGADKAVTPKDAASWLLWAGKDPSIANKSTGLTVDQAYETYLGFKPDDTARNYWTGGSPNKELTTAELAAITSEAYGLNPKDSGGLLGTGIGPDLSLKQAALLAGAYFGAPVLSGAIGGATGLTGAALSGATGAAIGGTGAALTGGNVLKGALTGGALAYGGGLIQEGLSGPTGATEGGATSGTGTRMLDYSVPTSTGGLGLQGTAALDGTLSSGLAASAGGSLGGGLGLTAGVAGNLGYMGGAQGLLANAAGGGTLGATGVNTGLFTADNLYPGNGVVAPTTTPSTTDKLLEKINNLTPTEITQLAKAGISVAGLLGGVAAVSGAGGGGGGLNLTQQDRSGVSSGSAQYSPEYYQAIQAKYNQMMPQQPRDVTTDLKNWYETKYAPKVA